MKITVLVDNNTFIDNYYFGEPGLSFLIEDDGKKILFDTGYSDIYLKNAKKMNIDLNNIDYLVLSHGHNDHTGGLQYINQIDTSNTTLIAHPGVFAKRNHNNLEIGCPIELKDLNIKEYIDGTSFCQITNNLYYLGQINKSNDFENRSIGYLQNGEDDFVKDDTALAYKTKNGLFIITGCSHSGICNIVEQAKRITNTNKIDGIIGGFHLLKESSQLDQTIEYFKNENINNLYPCHCVCLRAKAKMMEVTRVHEVGVGLQLNIEGE